MVAAGGGGDTIAAYLTAETGDPEVFIATWAWERLLVDPVPGPRTAGDFRELVQHASCVNEITAGTSAVPPSHTTLPRLAKELPVRLFLLDPSGGALGVSGQLTAIARHIGADEICLTDVGGDLVARGDEDELRSPLADALALAACRVASLPFKTTVCGPGLDGELSEQQVLSIAQKLHAVATDPVDRERLTHVRDVLTWHPSEATALFVAAAMGARGTVEIRDMGTAVRLADTSSACFHVEGLPLYEHNQIAQAIAHTGSLDEVESVIREHRGETEIDYERAKLKRPAPSGAGSQGRSLTEAIDCELRAAARRDAAFLTSRRLAELITRSAGRAVDPALLAGRLSSSAAPLWSTRRFTQE